MKNYCLLILLLLGLGFIPASYAQERLYIGKLSDVAAAYRKQAAAAADKSVNAQVSHSIPSKAPIQLKLNSSKREGSTESFYGEVANTRHTNFFLQVSGGVASGSIIMRDQKKYYRYSSAADGSVFLTEEDIDKVLCIGIPVVDESRVQQAPPVQASQITPEERNRLQPANAAGDRIAEIPFHESLPGAPAVMYLDFDGQVVSGTLWNSNFNSGNPISAAPSTLSNAEMTGAWKIMAEDYRPFNINVTTSVAAFNAAPSNRRMRVIFTPTNYFYPGAGGVAYIGSFTWGGTANGETPCWVWNGVLKAPGKPDHMRVDIPSTSDTTGEPPQAKSISRDNLHGRQSWVLVITGRRYNGARANILTLIIKKMT